jgi:hypothetical protein
LHGGDIWTREIEDALDQAEVVLAFLSHGSFASDTCRAEQSWSLDAGDDLGRMHFLVLELP